MEFGVALGFLALAIFGLQSLFSGRFHWIAPTYGMDNIMHFHRKMGLVAFLFVLGHPITLILTDPGFLSYFDPRVNLMRAIALSFVTVAIIGITVTSIWRVAFKLNYEKWRLLHGFLALAIVFVGVVHSIQVGHYLDPLWKKIALAVIMGASMYLVLHTRFVRPWQNKKRPYKIVDVKPERDECYSVTLASEKGRRLTFTPGQFAWITINSSPFTLQQHPFSFASSASDTTVSFTAKSMGDFTGTWKDLKAETTAFLEGPFGSFTPEPDSHLFFVMGGIGITPCMSMLRTMRDRKDTRKATLLYANKNWEGVTFREELEEISREINLKIVHVIEDLPEDEELDGEEGRIDQDMIEKYLPPEPNTYMYFICGPGPLMDVAEVAFHNLGINWRRIYSERFEIV
ncbi:xylene monooxygenase [Pontibacter qinzhouensis]|uniref:Xylene monooxygenase n=2 Tax=Pontibacter qinzhouensis TaxID=2603253 RepID=A0A5C8KD08_9BACT|nr:xylene monooxygenase [Pontibacter qinzhouensis]